MYKDLLPIGSVVSVKGAKRRFLICGRVVAKSGSDDIYDYVACLYPEGLIDPSNLYFFNRDAIEECLYEGYASQEETDFKEHVLGSLGEVEVVDGQIVPKNRRGDNE